MSALIDKNRYILRRYIRLLSQYKGMKDNLKAMQYFLVIHNFLLIEEMFYDQCIMNDTQINIHLSLMEDVRFCATALQYYRRYYDPNHKIRYSLENIWKIEDVRLFLESKQGGELDIYKSLILDDKLILNK